MLLHQAASHKSALPLGSKSHPIVIDADSQDEPIVIPGPSRYARPNQTSDPMSIIQSSTSSSKPAHSLHPVLSKDSSGQGRVLMRPSESSASQAASIPQMKIFRAGLLTLPAQDLMNPGSLKRKRDAAEDSEEAQAEAAKKLKKMEKKRRKKERRANRVAQLKANMPSTSRDVPGIVAASPPGMWNGAHNSNSNFNVLPEHPSWNHSMLGLPGFLPTPSFPHAQLLQFSGTTTYGMDVDTTGHNGSPDAVPPPPPYSEQRLSTGQESTSYDPPPRITTPLMRVVPGTVPLAEMEHAVTTAPLPLVNAVSIPPVTTAPIPSGSPPLIRSRSSPNADHHLPTQAQPLDPILHAELDPLPSPSSSTSDDMPSINEMIVAKQKLLDHAIRENKDAITLLSATITPAQKSSLMKMFSERTKLIAQLTSEIKAHFETLKAAQTFSDRVSYCPKFNWPETEFPLYVILTSDGEVSDGETFGHA